MNIEAVGVATPMYLWCMRESIGLFEYLAEVVADGVLGGWIAKALG